MSKLAAAVDPALAAAAGLVLGFVAYRHGWIPWLLAPLGIAMVICILLVVIGRALLRKHPKSGMMFMEVTFFGALIVTPAIGAVLFMVEIRFSPGKKAPTDANELYAGLTGAATTFLGAIFVAFAIQDDLIKKVIKRIFSREFNQQRNDSERDTSDAVALDAYGARAGGEEVDGWGWRARRLRARHLKRAIDAGCLS